MKGTNYLAWGAGIGAAIYTGSYLSRLGRIAKEIVIQTRSDFDPKKVEYIINATIKNPVSQGITIKQPFVKISYGNLVLASSAPNNSTVKIPANGQASFQLRVAFDRESVIRMAPGVAALILAGSKVELDAVVYSGLITPFSTIDFNKAEKYKIGF